MSSSSSYSTLEPAPAATPRSGPPPRTPDPAANWRRSWLIAAGVLLLLLIALIALHFEAAAAAVRVWYGSRTYNHGFLIIPIAAFLIWERRALFARLQPRPFYPALLLFPAFGAAWLVAATANVMEGQQFALMGMIQAAFLTVLGWRVYKALLFPLLYLIFLVPSGEFLVPLLQDFAASFAVFGLRLMGIPVYSDGIFITIPNGHFEVAEACAGLRFLIASIAFGFLFANMVYRSYLKRIVFVAMSIVVPVIANGFRVVGIILLAHYTDNEVAVGADHLIYGWGFFAAVTLLLILVGLRFREDNRPPAAETEPVFDRVGPLEGMAVPRTVSATIVAAGLLGALMASIAPAYAAYLYTVKTPSNLAALVPPPASGGWQPVPEAVSDWRAVFPNAEAILHQTYVRDDDRVDLFVAYYPRQTQSAKVIAYENRMTDDAPWVRSGSGRAAVPIDGEVRLVPTTRLLASGRQRLVAHWYWIDGRPVTRTIPALLLQVRGELVSGRRAAAVVAVSAEFAGSEAAAAQLIADFLDHLDPVHSMLARVAAAP